MNEVRPHNVPAKRGVDFDLYLYLYLYHPPEIEQGSLEAWLKLHAPGVPDLIWTPRNGSHWLATRGKLIAEVFANYERFSACV